MIYSHYYISTTKDNKYLNYIFIGMGRYLIFNFWYQIIKLNPIKKKLWKFFIIIMNYDMPIRVLLLVVIVTWCQHDSFYNNAFDAYRLIETLLSSLIEIDFTIC